MANTDRCDKCNAPVASPFVLNLIHNDGKEERIPEGKVPSNFSGVSVFLCVRCPKRTAASVQRIEIPRPITKAIDSAGRLWKKSDMTIRRSGDRYLLVLPWSK